ncbi:MAG: succinate--CoA ligase subunit alpha [Dehalococcoidia bacterium]
MSIIVNSETRLLVQGITGKEGAYHAVKCREYGTNLVAGVTPGKGGQVIDGDIPVFNTVQEAVDSTGADTSLVFVPPAFAADAIAEAADSGICTIASITEGIPVSDTMRVAKYIKGLDNVRLLGPNCPGVISPGEKCKVGIMPGQIHLPGNIGVVSRSGTLTYEAVGQLTALGIGQSTCVGIGGDPITGTSFIDVLTMFENDNQTDAVVLIGEIGGTREQEAAEFIKTEFSKPIAALIVGQSAPPGKRMGHAGAIITGEAAKASEKIRSLSNAGASIIPSPGEIGSTINQIINN